MNILIIEDEIKAARSLENLILKLRPESKIMAKIQSVEGAIDYLSDSATPDLIFIKENGIDYLLKPFSETDLKNAFEKVDNFKNFFQKTTENNLVELIQKISGEDNKKKSFLVFKNNKYMTVKTEDIAFIYINYTSPTMVTFKGEHFDLSQSLDQLASQLSDKDFFRLNRQYLISFSAVKEVEHYFARKLYVKLTVPTDDKLLIGKEKTAQFLSWLEDR
jgi:DNA-binding LytR/AlgR family response regulator